MAQSQLYSISMGLKYIRWTGFHTNNIRGVQKSYYFEYDELKHSTRECKGQREENQNTNIVNLKVKV